jgi:hypothetical protein
MVGSRYWLAVLRVTILPISSVTCFLMATCCSSYYPFVGVVIVYLLAARYIIQSPAVSIIHLLMTGKIIDQFGNAQLIVNIFQHGNRTHELIVPVTIQTDFNIGLIFTFNGDDGINE